MCRGFFPRRLSTPAPSTGVDARGRVVALSEFRQEIETRIQTARRSLDEARIDGDDYLIQVRLGEIESLERLAADHEDQSLAS
jgi:hypothetical protein